MKTLKDMIEKIKIQFIVVLNSQRAKESYEPHQTGTCKSQVPYFSPRKQI